jgi:hypothetical protein
MRGTVKHKKSNTDGAGKGVEPHGNTSLQLHPSPQCKPLTACQPHMAFTGILVPIGHGTLPLMLSPLLKAHAIFADLSREIPKGRFDIVSRHGVGFKKRTPHPVGQCSAFLGSDLSHPSALRVVADNNNWKPVFVLYPENLLLKCQNFFKGIAVRNTVDEQEAVADYHVRISQSRIRLLDGRIEYLQVIHLVGDDERPAVCVGVRRIPFI